MILFAKAFPVLMLSINPISIQAGRNKISLQQKTGPLNTAIYPHEAASLPHAIPVMDSITYDGLIDRNFSYAVKNGEVRRVLTKDYDAANSVHKIEKVIQKLATSNGPCYAITSSGKHRVKLSSTRHGEDFLRILKIDIPALKNTFPYHRLIPYVTVFLEIAEQMRLDEIVYQMHVFSNEEMHRVCAMLNDVVTSIREKIKSKEFKSSLSNHVRTANKNYRALVTYMNTLFKKHARLLTLRLDFGYEKKSCHEISQASAKAHLKKLLAHVDKLDFELAGYAWKMEFGLEKHFHFHVLLFFIGDEAQRDVMIGKMIGDYWDQSITQGKGIHWNCNAHKKTYRDSLGVGMIHYADKALMQGLTGKVAAYMTKPDYYVRLVAPGRGRTFGKKIMPVRRTNLGRPRARVNLQERGAGKAEAFTMQQTPHQSLL